MQKIFKATANEWLVSMTEEEYKDAYHRVNGFVNNTTVDVFAVIPTYRANSSFLKLVLTSIPALKIRPGDKLLISKLV